MRPRRTGANLAQAVEIITQAGVLDPVDIEAGAPVGVEAPHRLAGRPGLVGIDHDRPSPVADGLAQERQSLDVPVKIGMADLDLAAAKSEGRGLLEKLREMLVAEMEIEAARVGAHARVVPAEKAIERQTGLLRRKVPARLVDRPPRTAATGGGYCRRAAGRRGGSARPAALPPGSATPPPERPARSPPAPAAGETDWPRSRGRPGLHRPSTRASHNEHGRYEPGCRRLRGHAHIETALAESPRCASQPPSIVFWISDERSDKSDLMRDISASVLAASPFLRRETRTDPRTRAAISATSPATASSRLCSRIGSRRAPSSPKRAGEDSRRAGRAAAGRAPHAAGRGLADHPRAVRDRAAQARLRARAQQLQLRLILERAPMRTSPSSRPSRRCGVRQAASRRDRRGPRQRTDPRHRSRA